MVLTISYKNIMGKQAKSKETFSDKKDVSDLTNPIDEIFNEREDFIVVGFTGGTGAGCTSAADILGTELFSELKLHKPKNRDFTNSEERKYEIIYDYAQYHWDPFKSISMSDMIISFIIQAGYKAMLDLIHSVLGFNGSEIFKDAMVGDTNFENYFSDLQKEFNDCFDEDSTYNTLKRSDTEDGIAEREIECLEKISQVRSVFKDNLYQREFDSNDHENAKANAYTYFLQTVGDNLRISGKSNNRNFSGKDMAILARRANGFIKAFRSQNRKTKTKTKTLICIDAIRNPYEATYFQDRYNAFYLVAINTDIDERRRRLANWGLNEKQIRNLENKEYPRLKGNDVFTCIDIGACCELGDIHINNPQEGVDKYFLTEQLVKYVTLMKHPGLITPSAIERCMQIAYNAKLNSGCLSRQVGAVITDASFSIKAVGWNSTPEHQVPCNLRSLIQYFNNFDENAFSLFEKNDIDFRKTLRSRYDTLVNFAKSKNAPNETNGNVPYDIIKALKGRHYPYCFKDVYQKSNQVHTRSLHAEENAFLQLSKNGGEGIKGGNLFTTASSCVLCSKKAYHLGIKNIYYIIPYPDIAPSHIISFGKPDNEHNPKNILFSGAIGKAYTSLYTQRIAFKDELEYLVPSSNSTANIIKKLNHITDLFKDGKIDEAWQEYERLDSDYPKKETGNPV